MHTNRIDYDPAIRLARNFTLKEVCEWSDNLPLPDDEKVRAKDLAIIDLCSDVIVKATIQAGRLQKLRDRLNQLNPEYETAILITSWFRPLKWEKYKGRDGSSQHVKGWATDFTLTGLPSDLTGEAMQFAVEWLAKYESSKGEGFTRYYTDRNFIHNDARGVL